MDPLKVFIEHLHPGLNKPQVQEWLDDWRICYVDVYMRPPNDWTRCCFVSFDDIAAAQKCTQLNGCDDPDMTPSTIKAPIIVTQHGSLWSLLSAMSLALPRELVFRFALRAACLLGLASIVFLFKDVCSLKVMDCVS